MIHSQSSAKKNCGLDFKIHGRSIHQKRFGRALFSRSAKQMVLLHGTVSQPLLMIDKCS